MRSMGDGALAFCGHIGTWVEGTSIFTSQYCPLGQTSHKANLKGIGNYQYYQSHAGKMRSGSDTGMVECLCTMAAAFPQGVVQGRENREFPMICLILSWKFRCSLFHVVLFVRELNLVPPLAGKRIKELVGMFLNCHKITLPLTLSLLPSCHLSLWHNSKEKMQWSEEGIWTLRSDTLFLFFLLFSYVIVVSIIQHHDSTFL